MDAMINYIRFQKEVGPTTFVRQLITFQPHQIKAWERIVLRIFRELAEGKPPERNLNSCGGAFGSFPCQFTSLCEVNPENKELIANLKAFKYKSEVWEPWKLEEGED
jgi:hypothetical protein